MNNRELKLVAEAKEKEFDRLKNLALNQMSEIEVGLNIHSTARKLYDDKQYIWIPAYHEIYKLYKSLTELRDNQLTSEEREALNA